MPPFFVFGRDRPGTAEIRDRVTEEHWSFMDGYAEGMIARGPTVSDDGETVTGSLHIPDLPDADAAHTFAFDEPYHQAGVFGEVFVHPWRDLLGRTMWDFGGDPESLRFLVVALGSPGDSTFAAERAELIVYGELEGIGVAFTAAAPGRGDVDGLVAAHPGRFESVEIHRWLFGGRPAE